MVVIDASSSSVSGQFMKLAAAGGGDFQQVITFLEKNLDHIVKEVHGFDKIIIDDGNTQISCPKASEEGDNHGGELIRTVSELSPDHGEHLVKMREIKVHDIGDGKVEVRCDTTRAATEGDGREHVIEEEKATITRQS